MSNAEYFLTRYFEIARVTKTKYFETVDLSIQFYTSGLFRTLPNI